MSNNDPTYLKSGFTNPYGQFNPYSSMPSIPPPPPKSTFPVKWIVLISCAFVIAIAASFLASWYIFAPHLATARSTQPLDYTATTIEQDFLADHLPVVSPNYSQSLNTFVGQSVTTVSAKSEVSFIDPSLCNGPCGAGSTWLGVYSSVTDEETAYNDIRNFSLTNTNTPAALVFNQHGRCILIGQAPSSGYVLVINTDCI